MLKQIFSKWNRQYLLDLKSAHSLKNFISQSELEMGDIVLIEEDTKNKLLWKLGKVETAFLRRENNIISYEMKVVNGLLRRSVQNMYSLEI